MSEPPPDKPDESGFLRRWSQRKAEARAGKTEAQEPEAASSPDAADAEATEETFDPTTLPDVETLDAHSDYTGFLKTGVPVELQRLALRKLWRSDPVLANLDGLNDYDEDFSQIGKATEVVKTAYRVGKGYLADSAEDLPDETDAEGQRDGADTSAPESDAERAEDADLAQPGSAESASSDAPGAESGFHDVEKNQPG